MECEGTPHRLVGRVVEIDRAVSCAVGRTCGAVLITGVPGIGKSALAEAVADRLRSNGWGAVSLSATSAAGTVPFSSISGLVPDLLDRLDDPDPEAARLSVQRGLESALGLDRGERTVVLINEPASIDQATCEILVHLAANRQVFIVACQRPGAGQREALRRLTPITPQVIELSPLDFAETGEMAATVLGGPVAPALTRCLFQRTEGHPAYVRDLLVSATRANRIRLVGDTYQLGGDTTLSPEMAQQIIAGLGLLSPQEQEVLETLALAGTLGVHDLDSVIDLDQLEAMEYRGLIKTWTSRQRLGVALAHPLHTEAVAANMTALTRRTRHRSIAELMASRPQRRRDDGLVAMRIALDAGRPPDADVLLAAARQAFTADRIDDSAVFAAAAHRQDPSEATLGVLAESLVRQGRFVEADELLAQAARPTDDWRLARRAIRRSSNRLWGFGDVSGALEIDAGCITELADPEATARVHAHQAWIEHCDGWSGRALQRLEELGDVDEPGIHPDVRFAIVITKAPSLVLSGRVDEGAALAERAWDEGWGADTEFGSRGQNLIALAHGLLYQGDLAGARFVAESAIADCRHRRDSPPMLFFLDLAGWVELYAGDLDRALAHHEEALDIALDLSLATAIRTALAALTITHCHRADRQAADRTWHRLEETPTGSGPRGTAEIEWARAWREAVGGDQNRAAEILCDAAADARGRGLTTLEIFTIFDVVRLDRGDMIDGDQITTGRVGELMQSSQGSLLPLLCRAALAATEEEPDGLDDASSRLGDLGFTPWAADLAAAAADRWSALGQRRKATASQRQAAAARETITGVRTQALSGHHAVVPLTRREREVAGLAASGAGNAEIAERLVVSIRTVETHLGNAYRKLGVTNRRELADAITGEAS